MRDVVGTVKIKGSAQA